MKKTFTLVEMLVVIAIIAVLSSLLLPALGKAKGAAQGIKCSGNLKQLGIAMCSYQSDSNDYYPVWRHPLPPSSSVVWDFLLLDYVGYPRATYSDITVWGGIRRLGRSPDSPFYCPSDNIVRNLGDLFFPRSYAINFYGASNYEDGIAGDGVSIKTSGVVMPSQTIALGERYSIWGDIISTSGSEFRGDTAAVAEQVVCAIWHGRLGCHNYLLCDGGAAPMHAYDTFPGIASKSYWRARKGR